MIQWIAPYDNSNTIIGYDVEILMSDGVTWLNDLIDCPVSASTTC